MEIRKAFANKLFEYMKKNKKICVINTDLTQAHGLLSLSKEFKDRVINLGICEQNAVGYAAGMADVGMIPFVFSFATFITRRACDQIAVSLAMNNSNVRLIGSEPGIKTGLLGQTHGAVEDIAIMRAIPNITIFEVADYVQLEKAFDYIINFKGPMYIRIDRKFSEQIYNNDYIFDPNKPDILTKGNDVAIFASGIMVSKALEACKLLKQKDIKATVVNVHTIKPLNKDIIVKILSKVKGAVVAENHNKIGGLYSSISEVASEKCPTLLKSVAINDNYIDADEVKNLEKNLKLTAKQIVKQAKEILNKR